MSSDISNIYLDKEENNISIEVMEIKEKNKPIVINGWTAKNQKYIDNCLHRLKYNRIINHFYFFELKKQEGRLSWTIIVLSALSSLVSLLNSESYLSSVHLIIIKWTLIFLTTIITLIGSWIKKQQFVDRINNIGQYLQQINQTIEDINITLIIPPNERDTYEDFCKKYIPLIKEYMGVSPVMSPIQWKHTVYTITNYYPELIIGDGSEPEKLWPWYLLDKERKHSKFGELITKSYDNTQSRLKFYYWILCCKRPKY